VAVGVETYLSVQLWPSLFLYFLFFIINRERKEEEEKTLTVTMFCLHNTKGSPRTSLVY
jgi:ATP/ADP translocase